ncbi:TPR end-of-group domain-containing protein [Flavobacterium sp.]|uniref:TPR end-of-group domain-containing protein n=1 Tax=Flavobacterium sp. TaxID=239 RepID=UPI002B4B1241|nr:hypothetical protein [Flavobacterium sp.]HLP64386.1 hypothetical protein [Flavobacterium sp.]
MKKYIYSCVFVFITITQTHSQSQKEVYQQSVDAYKSKDYAIFLKLTKQLDSVRPFHPTYTYNLASAFALNGKESEAIATLKKVVLMNHTTAFETDDDFKSIANTSGFQQVLALKKSQEQTISNSDKVVSLSEKEVHPEGLEFLSKSNVWLASSIRKRKIVSFDLKTGKCKDWFTDNQLYAVFSMKKDANEQFLWVATSALPEMERFTSDLEGKAAVLKIDIATKKVVQRFEIAGNHVFGDLYVTKNNVVYVSDSNKPILYKIENDVMSEWISLENEAYNLQGITMNSEQNLLFVADYLKGIVAISLRDNERRWFTFPEGTIGKGIDGLCFYNHSLIAVQNGVKPIRLVRFHLNEVGTEIISYQNIDNNRPEFNEPALATIVKDKLYFFANSPWQFYDKNGNLDASKIENPMLFETKL